MRINMTLSISRNTKIYVASPSNVATGGPELLHQLVYHLRNSLNLDAYMYYFPAFLENPVHPNYEIYNCPFVKEIEDKKTNIFIVPEVIKGIELLRSFKKIQEVIWWLSIDNFITSYIYSNKIRYSSITFRRIINKISRDIFEKDNIFDINEIILKKYLYNKNFISKFLKEVNMQNIDLNLCQSYYAMNFLGGFGINNIVYLSDYLNKEFLLETFDINKKENIVTYNPQKGYGFTKKIISSAPNIKFVPIINMTRQQVIETLQQAKIYIDFGNHPGKDRVPREAAILGCCVITGKRGSAAFYEDVPVPEEYKFEDKKENIPVIIEKIEDCFENFDERYKDFDYYRQVIKQEPAKFIEDLKKIFVLENFK